MLEIKEVRHLVEDLQRARGDAALEDRGRAVFLIGAGCSRSAGIPLSREIAKDAATDLARMYSNEAFKSNDPDQALEWLKCNGKVNKEQLWDDLYGELFEAHYKDPREQQARIINAIERGDSAITPLLGELVRRCYVHTILTTNFDQLVLQGIVRTGILPVVADGIESLTRIDSRPRYPQVVYLHGSMHTYNLRNSRSAVADTALSKSLHRALYDLLRDSTVTVIAGYAGGEEGVMQLLTKAAAELPDKVMYWVSHGANPDDISPGAKKLLAQERNKFQIAGQDADTFFAEIMRGLGIGSPAWIGDPTGVLINDAERIALPDKGDIRSEIQRYRKRLGTLRDCQSEEDAAEKALGEIRELRLAGKHDQALERLRRLSDSRDPDVWSMRGDSAYRLVPTCISQRMLSADAVRRRPAWSTQRDGRRGCRRE